MSLAARKICIYARFSSELQNPRSIDDQVSRCLEFSERRGGRVKQDAVFHDAAISAASLDRPGFNRMMELVRKGQFDTIVYEDLSRLTRDIADAAMLLRELNHRGVWLLGVSDGTDSRDKNGTLNVMFRAFQAQTYLWDLSDKTLRGLEGRARAGLSTGGLPFGYDSQPMLDSSGRSAGSRIVINEAQAAIVQRIYEMYRNGNSPASIAGQLNAEHIETPRKSRNRQPGWFALTIRFILRNESYIGLWSFKKRQWAKDPGTNNRRYTKRDDSEVMRSARPDLRIIDEAVWRQVQARIAELQSKQSGGKPTSAVALARRTTHPLSGLLECGVCGAPMVFTGGSSAGYYVCNSHKKRRMCSNVKHYREEFVQKHVLAEIRRRFRNYESSEYLRKRIAALLGEQERSARAEKEQRIRELESTNGRIRNLVGVLANGLNSPAVREELQELEKAAAHLKTSITLLSAEAIEPVRLPSHHEIREYIDNLDGALSQSPLAAREALRRLFGAP